MGPQINRFRDNSECLFSAFLCSFQCLAPQNNYPVSKRISSMYCDNCLLKNNRCYIQGVFEVSSNISRDNSLSGIKTKTRETVVLELLKSLHISFAKTPTKMRISTLLLHCEDL